MFQKKDENDKYEKSADLHSGSQAGRQPCPGQLMRAKSNLRMHRFYPKDMRAIRKPAWLHGGVKDTNQFILTVEKGG